MAIIPPNNYTLIDLTEKAVERQFGKIAIAEIKNIEIDGRLFVERDGVRVLYEDDCQRWESMRELIRQAIINERLPAFVYEGNGSELEIKKEDWKENHHKSFADHHPELTIGYGWFYCLKNPELHGREVYFRKNDAVAFLNSLEGSPVDSDWAPPSETQSPSTKRKRRPPEPRTGRAMMNYFRDHVFIPLAMELYSDGAVSNDAEFFRHHQVKVALGDCPFPDGKPATKTLGNWIRIAKKKVGVTGKPGRPSKRKEQ